MIQRKLIQRIFLAILGLSFGSTVLAQKAEPQADYPVQPLTEFQVQDLPIAELVTNLDVVYAQEHFWTGIHLSPVDAALRAQLELAEDQGVVVSSIEAGSPAEDAGLEPHDLLLTVNGHPVADTDSFVERIQEGEDSATVVLLRGGKELSIEMTPRHRQWDVVTYLVDDQYRIGVALADVDESLRSQLGLPDERGLVVTDVHVESPAAEAGIEVHDILVEFGGKPLAVAEDLTSQIQEVGDRPATMVLVRRGEELRIRVTPAEQSGGTNYLSWIEADVLGFHYLNLDAATGEVIGDLTLDEPQQLGTEQQLEQLIQEMQDLTERMEALQSLIQSEAGGSAEVEEAAGGAGDDE